jgi:3-oxoacyl-[acyl-carrier protein] reductase
MSDLVGGKGMDLRIAGKVAVVGGASRGIGLAIAKCLAEEGAKVVIAARGEKALAAAETEIKAAGGTVLSIVCDLSDDASVTNLMAKAVEQFGRVDIVVSNASALSIGPERSDWEATIAVDLLGAVRLVEAAIPNMRAQKSGSILFVSSGSGVEATPGADFAYTSVKAALNAYAKKLAVVEAVNGIRVNAILPGSTEFPGGVWDMMRTQNPALYELARASIPFGRMGTPEDVADAAVWLVSERAAWVTGVALSVDGGQAKGIR